jgi:hypothetical protein
VPVFSEKEASTGRKFLEKPGLLKNSKKITGSIYLNNPAEDLPIVVNY